MKCFFIFIFVFWISITCFGALPGGLTGKEINQYPNNPAPPQTYLVLLDPGSGAYNNSTLGQIFALYGGTQNNTNFTIQVSNQLYAVILGRFIQNFNGLGTNTTNYGPLTVLATNVTYGQLLGSDATGTNITWGFWINNGGWFGPMNLIQGTNFQPSILTVTPDTKDPNARQIVAGAGVSLTDGGAGGTLTVSASGASTNAQVYATNVLSGGTLSTNVLSPTAGANGWVLGQSNAVPVWMQNLGAGTNLNGAAIQATTIPDSAFVNGPVWTNSGYSVGLYKKNSLTNQSSTVPATLYLGNNDNSVSTNVIVAKMASVATSARAADGFTVNFSYAGTNRIPIALYSIFNPLGTLQCSEGFTAVNGALNNQTNLDNANWLYVGDVAAGQYGSAQTAGGPGSGAGAGGVYSELSQAPFGAGTISYAASQVNNQTKIGASAISSLAGSGVTGGINLGFYGAVDSAGTFGAPSDLLNAAALFDTRDSGFAAMYIRTNGVVVSWVDAFGKFSANGGGITNLNGAKIQAGTVANAALANTGTAGTYTKTTFNAQGLETSGTTLSASDVPAYYDTNAVSLAFTWGGPSNTVPVDNGYHFYTTTTPFSFTNMVAATGSNLWSTVCISNQTASSITGYCTIPGVRIYGVPSSLGASNAVIVPSGKTCVGSFWSISTLLTNATIAVQSN